MDADKLMQRWQDENRAWHFEGDSGLMKLEELFKAVGYGHGFRFGDPIQAFLSDNPGACDALVEWFVDHMGENGDESFGRKLAESMGIDPDSEDEEDDEDEEECEHPGNFNQRPEGMVCLDCMKVVLA